MPIAQIITEILTGEYDAELEQITATVRSRKQMLSQSKFHALNVGDRVKFNNSVRPQYMAGQEGQIVGRLRTKVSVKLDEAECGRFRGEIRCPVSILDKIA